MAAKLRVSREDAHQKIEKQVNEGQNLLRAQGLPALASMVGDSRYGEDMRRAVKEKTVIWKEFTEQVLLYCFTDDSESLAFSQCFGRSLPIRRTASPLESAITKLKALLARLPLIPEEVETLHHEVDTLKAAVKGIEPQERKGEEAETDTTKEGENVISVEVREADRSVRLGSSWFERLPSRQFDAVKCIVVQYRAGVCNVPKDTILTAIGGSRWEDVFGSRPELEGRPRRGCRPTNRGLQTALIVPGERGTVRLNPRLLS